VRLGSRALGILIALLERPGELVSKQELRPAFGPMSLSCPPISPSTSPHCRRILRDGRDGNRFIITSPGVATNSLLRSTRRLNGKRRFERCAQLFRRLKSAFKSSAFRVRSGTAFPRRGLDNLETGGCTRVASTDTFDHVGDRL